MLVSGEDELDCEREWEWECEDDLEEEWVLSMETSLLSRAAFRRCRSSCSHRFSVYQKCEGSRKECSSAIKREKMEDDG